MSVYQDDPQVFEHELKEQLKSKARDSRDGGDIVELYVARNNQYPHIERYVIEATSFEGAILKYLKIVKSEYKEDELSIILEELSEEVGDIPIPMNFALEWICGKKRKPISPWSGDRKLYKVNKK
jgi:hypothetical protein